MLLSAVSVLVVAQSSSEIPEGLMNNTVYAYNCNILFVLLNFQAQCNVGQSFFLISSKKIPVPQNLLQFLPPIYFLTIFFNLSVMFYSLLSDLCSLHSIVA